MVSQECMCRVGCFCCLCWFGSIYSLYKCRIEATTFCYIIKNRVLSVCKSMFFFLKKNLVDNFAGLCDLTLQGGPAGWCCSLLSCIPRLCYFD